MAHAIAGRTDAGDAQQTEPVGKIAAGETTLSRAVDAWLEHLRRNGRSPNTVTAWRRLVLASCREAGITQLADINFENVDRHIGGKVERGDWTAQTAKGTLSAFKSFDRYLKRCRDNDLQAAEGMRDLDPGEGSRAASTEEIRTHLRTAIFWQRADGRARSNRALYVLALALAGCREEEPAGWTWEALHLEEPVPFIEWSPAMHKNKRRARVALAPELAEKLREIPPEQRIGPVFKSKPPKDVFRRDAERAEIPYTDDRGRPYTPHSLRKWHRTTLVGLGCPESIADALMRHHSLRGRYTDPTLEDQAFWLRQLPRLWPENDGAQPHGPNGPSEKMGPKVHKALTDGVKGTDTHGVTSAMPHTQHNPIPRRQLQKGNGADVTIPHHGGVGSACAFVHAGPSGPALLANQAAAFAAEVSALGAQPVARTVVAHLRALADLLDALTGQAPQRSPQHGTGQAG